ncbi:MAG: DUF6351 family protein [Marinobacter sp.]|nr:DUF6351 family protein [Marinobacter sp.]
MLITGVSAFLDSDGNKVGLSKDCSIDSFVTFFYRTTGGKWAPLPEDGSRPGDLATTELTDGRVVDFIVRQERGIINRFIYSYASVSFTEGEAARLGEIFPEGVCDYSRPDLGRP